MSRVIDINNAPPEIVTVEYLNQKYMHLDQYVRDRYPTPDNRLRLYTLDTDALQKLHDYAEQLCEYLVGNNIPAIYNTSWAGNYNVCIYGDGSWRIDRYYLQVRPTTPDITDIWVGMSSIQYVWANHTSEEVKSLPSLIITVKQLMKQVEAWDYCSQCHYSDSTAQYCGKGLALIPGCISFKAYENQ
jgi:hypothetical protein